MIFWRSLLCFAVAFSLNFTTIKSAAASATTTAPPVQSAFDAVFQADAKTLASKVYALVEERFDDCEIEYNERMFYVYVSTNGLASKLQAAYEDGQDANWEPWVKYKESLLDIYQSIVDLLASHGRTDIAVDLWVWNDDAKAEKDTRFMSYLATIGKYGISYDAMYRTPLPINQANEPLADPSTYSKQASIEAIQASFGLLLRKSSFDYYNITYNEDGNRFYVETAMDGLVDRLIEAKNAGYDETWDAWVQVKSATLALFNELTTHLESVGREDTKIFLAIENDDIVLRGDYGTIDYSPILSVGVFGNIVTDIMAN